MIRGCEVHFKRVAKKVAEKVTNDHLSCTTFNKIAYAIPVLESRKEVMLALRILSGKVSFDDIAVHDLLTIKIRLDETEMEACAEGWKEAEHWAVFWSKEKVVKMFTKACKDMTDAEWNSCPRTTNAVESQNALGKIKLKRFSLLLKTCSKLT